MRFVEKPDRIDREIRKEQVRLKRFRKRLLRVDLNPAESRTFWEDLIESEQIIGDPDDDAQFQAFVALGPYDFFDTRVRLNVEGV